MLTDGHIEIGDHWKKRLAAMPAEQRTHIGWPIPALLRVGDELWATDALGGQLLRWKAATADVLPAIKIPLPMALAADAKGRVVVAHEGNRLSVVESGRVRPLRATFQGVTGMACLPDGRFLLADQVAGTVRIFTLIGDEARETGHIGRQAVPGDREPDAFFNLSAVAAGADGRIAIAQNEPLGGARLAIFSSAGGPLEREHFATMFISMTAYGRDPDELWSMNGHSFRLRDRTAGT